MQHNIGFHSSCRRCMTNKTNRDRQTNHEKEWRHRKGIRKMLYSLSVTRIERICVMSDCPNRNKKKKKAETRRNVSAQRYAVCAMRGDSRISYLSSLLFSSSLRWPSNMCLCIRLIARGCYCCRCSARSFKGHKKVEYFEYYMGYGESRTEQYVLCMAPKPINKYIVFDEFPIR